MAKTVKVTATDSPNTAVSGAKLPSLTKKYLTEMLEKKLSRFYGTTMREATKDQVYRALLLTVKDILSQKRTEFKHNVNNQEGKKIYYLCMEFLIGKSLRNNLMNLGVADKISSILGAIGISLDELYEIEQDPGLGNGGLGRLAACFMDALTSQNYSATGFSILYEYGLFKQKIIDGDQIELPDTWMPSGEPWLVPRTDKTCTVRFGGQIKEEWKNGRCEITHTDYTEVQAIPYDMMISGADSEAVNSLRLWKAKSMNQNFNMSLFSQGEYIRAMEESTRAEILSKVLYPADDHEGGKLLRLSQQYFLVCASLQSIIADHLRTYGTLANFSEKVAIHINDTHPALVVPELMRILIDTYSYTWEHAWSIVTKTVSYTNHTVMPEALETWDEGLFRFRLPRLHMIVSEINRRFCAELWNRYPGDWDRITGMSVISHGAVKMANLSVVASHTVNGVSKLHSEILTDTIFKNFYHDTPEKFTNVTNGIAYRRWLCYSNPALANLLDETIGKGYRKDAAELEKLLKFADDKTVLDALDRIKHENKVRFSNHIMRRNGIKVDPDSVFDVQVKRMHEYKRQLLNALHIISLYVALKENPDLDMRPKTFIFGAKAAAGYYLAKEIIKLIYEIGKDLEKDPKLSKKLSVIFPEDYNVSLAEVLIPAADISEQISLAGKEASGTGNMKFMLNGALTLGTLDGANVEIAEAVGSDNIYIFGHTTPEVEDLWKQGYHAIEYYTKSSTLTKAVDMLKKGFNGVSFEHLYQYLVYGGGGVADPYMCLADFDAYLAAHKTIERDYEDRDKWNRMSLVNIAKSGIFSADRSIREYADNIWGIKPIFKKNNK
ncbi:MAG: glycogen/starch/alpha-glucan phosphorylase [Clostridia bacterium]|nr:glycogen/starch/alpha-glucan phosphorylase [Clostridia bacterium]